jgi:hypothetical protein
MLAAQGHWPGSSPRHSHHQTVCPKSLHWMTLAGSLPCQARKGQKSLPSFRVEVGPTAVHLSVALDVANGGDLISIHKVPSFRALTMAL